MSEAPEQIFAALKDARRRRILFLLAEQSLSLSKLSEIVEMSPSKLHFHIRELLQADLIKLTQKNRTKVASLGTIIRRRQGALYINTNHCKVTLYPTHLRQT